MTFFEKLSASVKKNNSLLCVGLDSDIEKIPKHLLNEDEPLVVFNKAIIDTTHDLVCCYKPNIAYYEASGFEGLKALSLTINYIREVNPEIPILIDAKRADIDSTSIQYAKSLFEYFQADATTVNPYLGMDALEPFFSYKEKGVAVLCKTSNKGSSDLQDLVIDGEPLFLRVAKKVVAWDEKYQNCLMVIGAAWPEHMREIRGIAPHMNFLVPGVGFQGGDLEGILRAGLREDKAGLIISASRSIIYKSEGKDFPQKAREEAQKLRDQINTYRYV